MSNCNDKNTLQRDGSSQQQRLLPALRPDYVLIDERTMEDLKVFAVNYAEEINFFRNELEILPGQWNAFFKDKKGVVDFTDPHYALFLAFLKMFRYAQKDLNKITGRHLDFYYKEVLQLQQRPQQPDQAFVLFQLARHKSSHLIPKGTLLKAGKDKLGKTLFYETDNDYYLNKANIASLKAFYLDASVTAASSVANSADGMGKEIEADEKRWKTFGKQNNIQSTLAPSIGFAFASPVLFLAEGQRTITMILDLAGSHEAIQALAVQDLNQAFNLYFSGEEEWIVPDEQSDPTPSNIVTKRILDFLNAAEKPEDIAAIEPKAGPVFDHPRKGYGDQDKDYDIGLRTAAKIIEKRKALPNKVFTTLKEVLEVPGVGEDKLNDLVYSFSINNTVYFNGLNQLVIKKTIAKSQKAIVGYNRKILLDPFDTIWPVVKILLTPDLWKNPGLYLAFRNITIKKAKIEVEVSGLKNLVIQNEESRLDPSKPFLPFGSRPCSGSAFYIGSNELFRKDLNFFSLNIVWDKLPKDISFDSYYALYTATNENENNERKRNGFVSSIDLLYKKSWIEVRDKANLFDQLDGSGYTKENRILEVTYDGLKSVKRVADLQDQNLLNTDTQSGFIRMKLGPVDFGHKDYQAAFARQVLMATVGDEHLPPNSATPLPYEPYTPQMKEISIDYVASETIVLNELTSANARRSYEERIERFFHIHPFGVAETHKYLEQGTSDSNVWLLPVYNEEGALYIGINGLEPQQNLSLLFKVAEGSEVPDIPKAEIIWSYLKDNHWVPFDKKHILRDTTNGMLNSGVLIFSVPKEATNNNTLLTSGLHWIKCSVTENSASIPDLISVHAQAVIVRFKDQQNDPSHLETALPAETIQKLNIADSAIEKVIQPYASYGGKIKERPEDFYRRISERLRHKHRTISLWDYEHIVLEKFSSVYKVKCLNHTRFEGTAKSYSPAAPGHVSMIVVPDLRNRNAVDPLRPRLSLSMLTEIGKYIQTIRLQGTSLHIGNPLFEEIKVSFKVKFVENADLGFSLNRIVEGIKAFLSPWAYGGTDIIFGDKIHKSVILQYVEEQEYVDYVTCFDMYHIVPGNPSTMTKVDEAVASTAASILGSADTHDVIALESEACECEENDVRPGKTIAPPDECACDDEFPEITGAGNQGLGVWSIGHTFQVV